MLVVGVVEDYFCGKLKKKKGGYGMEVWNGMGIMKKKLDLCFLVSNWFGMREELCKGRRERWC